MRTKLHEALDFTIDVKAEHFFIFFILVTFFVFLILSTFKKRFVYSTGSRDPKYKACSISSV